MTASSSRLTDIQMLIDTLSDHELFLALKSQNAEAWRSVWEKVVQSMVEKIPLISYDDKVNAYFAPRRI